MDLGISGNSCLQYLKKKNNVKVFDDNILLKNKRYKKFFLKKNEISKLKFDYIVLSPGIDIQKCKLKKYLLKNKKKIITELDIFYLRFIQKIKKSQLQVQMVNLQLVKCYITYLD